MKMTDIVMVDFCVGCFATNVDGSYVPTGTSGDGTQNFCSNCGEGSIIHIANYQAKSIRDAASWVGKRYYPHPEDFIAASHKTSEELSKYVDMVNPESVKYFSLTEFADVYRYKNEIIQISVIKNDSEYILYTNFPQS